MFNCYISILSLLVLLLVSCSSGDRQANVQSGQKYESDSTLEINLDVKKYVLPNGLRVLIYENNKLPIYSYYTFYDVGGRYEGKGLVGATHYLEHMMFKGAKKYGPGEFDKIIEGSGGSNNAYTSFDSTVYHENLPVGSIDKIIDLEADRMVNLLVEPASFERERKVILDERLRRYDTNPRQKIFLTMMEAVFGGTPYGRSVIGTVDEINGITRERMLEYFKIHYAPNNAVVVIAGDVDADKIMKLIRKSYGQIPASKNLQSIKEGLDDNKRYTFRRKLGYSKNIYGVNPLPMFMLAFRGMPLGSRKGFVMDILSSIMGDGQSSHLHQLFVLGKRPMLTNISAGNYTLKKNGVFYISGQLLGGVNKNTFRKKLLRELYKVCNSDKAINKRSVQKTKNQYLIQYFSEIQSNNGMAHFLGLRENFFGDYNYYKEELSIYNSIDEHEVKKTCKEVFKPGSHVFLSIWNKNAN